MQKNIEKPNILSFLKCQNSEHYLMTGSLQQGKNVFVEKGYFVTRSISDIIELFLFLLCAIGGIVFFSNILNGYFPFDIWRNDNVYDSQIWLKHYMYVILFWLFAFIWIYVIIPAIMKIFKILAGFRWFFVKFGINEEINTQHYLYFYINNFSFRSSSILFRKWKKAVMADEENINNLKYSDRLNIIIRIYSSLIRIIFICSILMIDKTTSSTISIILFGSLVAIYCLSHVVARYYWKKA